MTPAQRELGFGDYVAILQRRWKIVAGSLLAVVAFMAVFTAAQDRTYEADAEVLIMTEETVGLFSFDRAIEAELVRNPLAELQLAESEGFIASAGSRFDFESDVVVELVAPPGSESLEESSILRMTATDTDPEQAQMAAQAYAEDYVRVRAESDLTTAENGRARTEDLLDRLVAERSELRAPIAELRDERLATTDVDEIGRLNRQIADLESDQQSEIDSLTAQITEAGAQLGLFDRTIGSLSSTDVAARILEDAETPSDPVSPDVPRNLLVAVFIGLLIGLVVATLRELFDTSAHDADAIVRQSGTPFIARIPLLDSTSHDSGDDSGDVVMFDDLPDDQAKAYSLLLNAMWLGGSTDHIGCIAVMGDHAGVGTTQTVVNIAHAESNRGTAVCIVDTSLEDPTLAGRCGLDDRHPGFADLLADTVSIDDAVQSWSDFDFVVLSAGKVSPATPGELRSDRLSELLVRLLERYELVIFDVPPVTSRVDSEAVAAACRRRDRAVRPGHVAHRRHRGHHQCAALGRRLDTRARREPSVTLGFVAGRAGVPAYRQGALRRQPQRCAPGASRWRRHPSTALRTGRPRCRPGPRRQESRRALQ